MRDIVIYGCGGFGREVLQVIHAINAEAPRWHCLGFAVDPGVAHPDDVHGLPVADDPGKLRRTDQLDLVIAIGAPAARCAIAARLEDTGLYAFPSLVHPQAWIGDRVPLPPGLVVCAGACITTDITLGAHVHVNLAATIGHDARIGACCTLSPGVNVSGKVILGDCIEIGTGASVVPGVEIGTNSVIGAGAAVIRTIPADSTAVGVPAKIIKGG